MLNRSGFIPFLSFTATFCLAFTAPATAQDEDTAGDNVHDRRGLIWYANWTQTF